MRVLINHQGLPDLWLCDALMQNGVAVRGHVENGGWEYEVREGRELSKDAFGNLVSWVPLRENLTYTILEN